MSPEILAPRSMTAMPIEAPMTDVVPADRIGRADCGEDAPGNRLQRIGVGAADSDDRKFVAAETSNKIIFMHDLAEAFGDVENELIADMVPERIVDVLEVVEVDEEHGGRGAAPTHFIDQMLSSCSPK